jgi:hypothetical protein
MQSESSVAQRVRKLRGLDPRESKPNQRVFGAAKGDPEADSALHHAEFSDHVRNHPNYHQPEPHGASE